MRSSLSQFRLYACEIKINPRRWGEGGCGWAFGLPQPPFSFPSPRVPLFQPSPPPGRGIDWRLLHYSFVGDEAGSYKLGRVDSAWMRARESGYTVLDHHNVVVIKSTVVKKSKILCWNGRKFVGSWIKSGRLFGNVLGRRCFTQVAYDDDCEMGS